MSDLYHRLLKIAKEESVSNFIHLSLNQGVNILVALILTPYLFQTLGEDQFGLVSVALTVILLFGMLVNYGFNLTVPQTLAVIRNNIAAKQSLINEAIVTRLLISLVLAVILLLGTYYLGLFEGYSIILAFSVIQLFNDALYPIYILQGFDRLSWIAKANAISKLLYLGLVIVFVNSPADSIWVNFLLGSTGLLVHGILLMLIYRSESIKLQWVGFDRIGYWLSNNFQFFLSTVAGYITVNAGTIILKNFVDNAELGFYALAQRVAILLRTVPVFITQAITQEASRLYVEDKSKFEAYLKKTERNGLIITFIVCFLFAIFSKIVVRILAGESIGLSANLLSILSFLPFIGMFNITNMVRIYVSQEKYILSMANWITTGFMLIVCTVACYFFNSYGLAFGLVLVEIFNYFIHLILLKNRGLR